MDWDRREIGIFIGCTFWSLVDILCLITGTDNLNYKESINCGWVICLNILVIIHED